MKLTEIYETIRHSSREDWHYIAFHSGNGSSYLHDAPEGPRGGATSQPHRAVYRENVSLAVDFGLDHDRDLTFDYISSEFPSAVSGKESVVAMERIDILWNGTVVDRAFYLSSREHRFWIPAADHYGDDHAASETDVRLLEILYVLEVDHPAMHYKEIRPTLERLGVPIRPGDPLRADYR